MRYFPYETLELTSALLRPEEVRLVREAVNEVLGGFGRCLVTFGERGTGKTRLLFGPGTSADPASPQGLVGAFLSEVFAELVGKEGVRDSAVALAACLVRGNRVEDVFGGGGGRQRQRVEDLALVDCPTLSVAEELLRRAVRRAAGGQSSEDRAHLVLRVLVHQTRTTDLPGEGLVGSLVVADMVGTSPVTGAEFSRLGEEDRIRRRLLALHLHTLVRVLEQMSEASQRAEVCGPLEEADAPLVTAARDSALTSLLCPVLQGNAATAVLALVGNGEEHFAATKRTLIALEPVLRISCAVYSCSGVSLSSLRPQNPSTVLPRPPYDPLLPLGDRLEDLDLERLAYGDVNYPLRTSEGGGRGKAASEWTLQLGELMSQLHATLGASTSPEAVSSAPEPLSSSDAPDLNLAETNAQRSDDTEALRRSNMALLEEADRLRLTVDQLRHQLVDAQDAAGESRTELEAKLGDREVRMSYPIAVRLADCGLAGDHPTAGADPIADHQRGG